MSLYHGLYHGMHQIGHGMASATDAISSKVTAQIAGLIEAVMGVAGIVGCVAVRNTYCLLRWMANVDGACL
jgi:hypothetical protein